MTGASSSSSPSRLPRPAAVVMPENREEVAGVVRFLPPSISLLRPPISTSEPLPVSFWGRSKNKSGSKYGVIPRV
ncbi:hypothetical protein L3X38_024966 [Prunus dulcis]|uniref:Uncharacterized protein n=1 Tax=Prunus dulcis TaxID=3755 RepID=A0AAD4W0X0_PRUDU|nr:hypothetical protein L3X38_024966 [Prunus dulcis]